MVELNSPISLLGFVVKLWREYIEVRLLVRSVTVRTELEAWAIDGLPFLLS